MSLLGPNLEAFLAIARTRSVHAGAAELGITQTGATQRIRALERRLATTLFLRSRRGMTLTHEGQALLKYCQAARDLEGEALARIQKGGRVAEVRVCLTGPTSLLSTRVAAQSIPVLKNFPELLLTLAVSDLDSRIELLRTSQAQLAIVSHEHVGREMASKVLRPERYVLVATRRWRGRRLKDLVREERVIDFDESDTTTHRYLKRFGLEGYGRPERHFVNNNEALVRLLSAGAGYGVLTLDVAKPLIDADRLVALNGGETLENKVALAWYPRHEMPAYLSALVKAIS